MTRSAAAMLLGALSSLLVVSGGSVQAQESGRESGQQPTPEPDPLVANTVREACGLFRTETGQVRNQARERGPLQVSTMDGQLDMPIRVCPRSTVSLGGDALLVADTPEFFGNIRASVRLGGSVALDDRFEVSASFEALRYQSVISSVTASYVGLGYLSLAGQYRVHGLDHHAVGVRLVLPTTTGLDQGGGPLGFSVHWATAAQFSPELRVHGWVNFLGSVGLSTVTPPEPRFGLAGGAGLDWSPQNWLSLVFEAQTRLFYGEVLDQLALQVGGRVAMGSRVGLALDVSLPIIGVRALDDGAFSLAATLMLTYVF